MEEKFATTSWMAEDVLTLRPNWTRDQAEEFLNENEKHINEAMVSAGWTAIETLLPK